MKACERKTSVGESGRKKEEWLIATEKKTSDGERGRRGRRRRGKEEERD